MNGSTPLHLVAVQNDAPEIIGALLKAGADIESRDENGRTPLHRAVAGGISSSICMLMKAGADATAKDEDGATPFDLANEGIMDVGC